MLNRFLLEARRVALVAYSGLGEQVVLKTVVQVILEARVSAARTLLARYLIQILHMHV